MMLADYANVDAAGKLNILGGAWTISNILPGGLSAPQTLAIVLDVPPKYVGEEFALGIALYDERLGSVVKVPDEGGDPAGSAIRVQQLVRAEKPMIPGLRLPTDFYGRVQTVLAFPTGLPLAPNGEYAWRLEVDGTHRKAWRVHFITSGPPPAPVLG